MTTLEYTNEKLNNWYKNAKIDYNVIGSASASIRGDKFEIDYTENGVSKTWSIAYFGNEDKDFFFNVWMEEA